MKPGNLTLPEVLLKTIQHFAPSFAGALSQIHDPRNPRKITYPLEEEILMGILLFLLKLESRRNLKFELNTPELIQNLKGIGKIFFPKVQFSDTILHGDTLNYLLKKIAVIDVENLRVAILRDILRKKCLEEDRLFNQYYPIAIDGTGSVSFTTNHCRHCLRRENSSNHQIYFYHPILEAKLVAHGMAFSIATEFIQNESQTVSKQDCELKAFYRLEQNLKKNFPQLRICLLLDGLYAAEPVFEICQKNHWAYLITFKEGSMPATFKEYQSLKRISLDQTLTLKRKNLKQTYCWVNDIDYKKRYLNVLECREEMELKSTRFVFLSSIKVNTENVAQLSTQGRCRWSIENQGFNIQKNGGYGLEHAFSQDTKAMKNFYLLMQIAHIFNQLIEKGTLLKDRIARTMGSLRVLSQKLLSSLTEKLIDFDRLKLLIAWRIQVRFDSS